MAVAKLGLIITDISGSIGGTTLKRQSGNIAVYNKSRGANKSILYQNKALGRMTNARNIWNNYDPAIKAGWNNTATEFTFPDKFGTPRNITGYQLYTKCENALKIVGTSVGVPAGYNQVTDNFYLEDFTIFSEDKTCNVIIQSGAIDMYFLISFDVNCKEGSKPIYNKRKIYANTFGIETLPVGMDNTFWDNFPWVLPRQFVRLYCTPMNQYGYKGVTQIIECYVDA
jgi:hypothetical protein